MGINLGSTAIAGLKLGTTQVDKIYLGSTQAWSGSSPTPTPDIPGWGYIKYLDGNSVEQTVTMATQSDWEALSRAAGSSATMTIGGATFTGGDVTEIGVGNNVTALDYQFAAVYLKLKQVYLPSTLTSIGDECFDGTIGYTGTLTLPSGLQSIGTYFMNNSYINTPITIPAGATVGRYFLRGCPVFNSVVTIPEGFTDIPVDFLYNCQNFNQPITFPSTLSTIGLRFMQGCSSFNQNITLPPNLTSLGAQFLRNANAMCSTINLGDLPSTVVTQNNGTLSTTDSTAPMYTTGITLVGTYVADWMATLPNRSTSPYRNLIDGSS
jgi:hypothetical protein